MTVGTGGKFPHQAMEGFDSGRGHGDERGIHEREVSGPLVITAHLVASAR